MKTGYDQFFKSAKKNASKNASQVELKKGSSLFGSETNGNSKNRIKYFSNLETGTSAPIEKKQRNSFPLLKSKSIKGKPKRRVNSKSLMASLVMGVLIAGTVVIFYDPLEKFFDSLEISFTGSAIAAEPKSSPKDKNAEDVGDEKGKAAGKGEGMGDPKSDGKGKATEKNGVGPGAKNDKVSGARPSGDALGEENTDAMSQKTVKQDNLETEREDYLHLSKLKDRKKELDSREEELARAEAELELQKKELETRLKDLENTRKSISTVLQDRAQADDKKVDDLVQVYSNMKPQQAAKVFESMDEDLAVEIIGRMKRKPAAEILNLLKPEKAQVLSEKYTGYKRR